MNDHESCDIDNPRSDLKTLTQVETLDDQHLDIHDSSNTNGEDRPNIIDNLLFYSEDLYFEGLNLEFYLSGLQSLAMGWDNISI